MSPHVGARRRRQGFAGDDGGSDRGIDVPDPRSGRGDDHGVAETCERERDRMHLDGGVGNHDVSNHHIGEAFQSHLHGVGARGYGRERVRPTTVGLRHASAPGPKVAPGNTGLRFRRQRRRCPGLRCHRAPTRAPTAGDQSCWHVASLVASRGPRLPAFELPQLYSRKAPGAPPSTTSLSHVARRTCLYSTGHRQRLARSR